MNLRIASTLSIVFCVLVSFLSAQEKTDPAFDKIAPFLKENTYLVLHVDLAKLDLDAIFDQIKPRVLRAVDKVGMGDNKKYVEDSLAYGHGQLAGFLSELKIAGVDDFFVLSQMETLQTCPSALVFPGQPNFSDALKTTLAACDFKESGTLDGMMFYAMLADKKGDPTAFLKTIRTLKSKTRPEINSALLLQSRSPVRIVFAPSPGMKGMGQMMLPALLQQFPFPIDQQRLARIIQDVNSVSAGINLAEPRINLAAEFPSNEHAQSVGDFLIQTVEESANAGAKAALDAMGDRATPEMKAESAGRVDAMKAAILAQLPKVNKNRLVLGFDAQRIEASEDMLTALLLPAVLSARQAAVRQSQESE